MPVALFVLSQGHVKVDTKFNFIPLVAISLKSVKLDVFLNAHDGYEFILSVVFFPSHGALK